MEKERTEKRKSRTRGFFGLGGGNKSSAASTTNTDVQPTDDGQELDDLISALRSGDIFDDVKRRKNKRGKSTKTFGDSSKHKLI